MRYIFLALLVFSATMTLHAQSVSMGKKTFPNVQMAINKAKPGSVIEIRGLHSGSLKLNKKGITLRGENPETDGLTGTQGPVIIADGKYGAEELTIENLTIKNGNATDSPGGGIMLKRVKGESILKNLIITQNKTEKAAGGVMIVASRVLMENCWIHENYAAQHGGGLVLQSGNASDAKITVRNTVVSANTSEHHGGAIYVNGNPKWGDQKYLMVTIENSIFTYNSTAKRGGAIFIKGALHQGDKKTNTAVKLNHVTAAYNRSTNEKGKLPGVAFFAVEGEEPSMSILNSLIVSNGAEQEPDVNFGRSSVLANSANIYGKLMGLKVANVDMSSSRIINNPVNVGLSHKLTRAAAALPELRLTPNSAAIDKADPETALKVDINGRERLKPDIGAVEFNH